jgi:hypothetical protein
MRTSMCDPLESVDPDVIDCCLHLIGTTNCIDFLENKVTNHSGRPDTTWIQSDFPRDYGLLPVFVPHQLSLLLAKSQAARCSPSPEWPTSRAYYRGYSGGRHQG